MTASWSGIYMILFSVSIAAARFVILKGHLADCPLVEVRTANNIRQEGFAGGVREWSPSLLSLGEEGVFCSSRQQVRSTGWAIGPRRPIGSSVQRFLLPFWSWLLHQGATSHATQGMLHVSMTPCLHDFTKASCKE